MNDREQKPSQPAWLEARLSAPAPQAEAAADFFTNLTGHGVILEEPAAPGGPVTVRAYVEVGPESKAQQAALERYVAQLAQTCDQQVELAFTGLAEEDWAGAWREYFHPRLVTQRLIVAPPWEKAQPQGDQVVLVIDPGQAFGTGQHQSTQLILRHLERLADFGELPATLLDVGCGSGILGLAALRFGARHVLGIDVDPEAIAASQANAELNGLSAGLEVSLTPLEDIEQRFPLVLANIIVHELCLLAQPLVARLAPGGELVLSGLLVDQINQVREAFGAQGLSLKSQDSLAGWACLVMS